MATTSPPLAATPIVFAPTEARDRTRIAALLDAGARWHDVLDDMVVELAHVRAPGRFDHRQEALAYVRDGRDCDTYRTTVCNVVYFPWIDTLMPCLPPEDCYEVRTARNRNRLRPDEQSLLHRATLAFVGCSVGATVATACVLEGIGRRLHLMDFDTLSLTNLNRLSMGMPDLGENKAALLARRLWSIDPYLEIAVEPAGASPENLAAVVADSDVVVEECDDLAIKIAVRQTARALRTPVVMATDDGGGLLDVEDFRTGTRPLLHGLLEGLSPAEAARLSPSARVERLVRVIGPDAPLPFLESIDDWAEGRLGGLSQLAEDVHLAAAMVVRAVTGLLLPDRRLPSGRWRADLGVPASDVRALTRP